jgi:hypothetical protein
MGENGHRRDKACGSDPNGKNDAVSFHGTEQYDFPAARLLNLMGFAAAHGPGGVQWAMGAAPLGTSRFKPPGSD